MPCKLCHKDLPLNDQELCEECAGNLSQLDSSSLADSLQSLQFGKQAASDGDQATETGEPAPRYRITGEIGNRGEVTLNKPFSVSVDDEDNVYVLDRPERRIYRVVRFSAADENGVVVVECKQGSGDGELRHPKGICVDENRNIYIPDAGNDRIQVFDSNGEHVDTLGEQGEEPGEFDYPCDVETDRAGAVYVADTGNNRIQRMTSQGVTTLEIGEASGEELSGPLAVDVDDDRRIYVADTGHHRVLVFDDEGKLSQRIGEEGDDLGQFVDPSDVRVTDKAIYIADRDNTRVQRFSHDGRPLAVFSLGREDGINEAAGGDIAIDGEGQLLICDTDSNHVMRVEWYEDVAAEASSEPESPSEDETAAGATGETSNDGAQGEVT